MRDACLLVILALSTPMALAADDAAAPAKPRPLVGMRCLDPGPASGWTYIDDRHIVIDGGAHKYRMEFTQSCWGLDFDMQLAFKGDRFSGRVCGDPGDEVITRNQHCQVKHLEIISTDEYRQEIRDAKAAKEARKAERAKEKSGSP